MRKALKISLIIIAVCVLIAIIVFRLSVNTYRMKSDSMLPTWKSEHLIMSYRFKTDLKRGDLIVYKKDGIAYAKRLIGLPGDKIKFKADELYINGDLVVNEYKDNFVGQEIPLKKYRETLPNGKSYYILKSHSSFFGNVEYTVPDNAVFVMGDNRDNAMDSRHPNTGYINKEDVRKALR